jgi:hypothetical protein
MRFFILTSKPSIVPLLLPKKGFFMQGLGMQLEVENLPSTYKVGV